MRLHKTFFSAEMPPPVADFLWRAGSLREDGLGTYNIGYYAAEAARDPAGHDPAEAEEARIADAWFRANGAVGDECVIVAHGSEL